MLAQLPPAARVGVKVVVIFLAVTVVPALVVVLAGPVLVSRRTKA